MSNSFLSNIEILDIGFKKIGDNCLISKNASFYNPSNIILGDNVRIDDFCILSGKIEIGTNVHISAYCALYGSNGIQMGNYSGLSPRCTIFSAVDDFSGEFLINPMVPKEFTKVTGGMVVIGDFVQLGANSLVMPSVTIGNGAVSGAFTFINSNLLGWGIYTGIPATLLKKRKKDLLKFIKHD